MVTRTCSTLTGKCHPAIFARPLRDDITDSDIVTLASGGAGRGLPVADNAKILIINGPNLNMLGVREPSIYGSDTLADIKERCHAHARKLNLEIDFRQSNFEGELVTWIQECRTTHQGVIINGAAFTHTSVAILDALSLLETPIIEVHLSNIFAREHFRHHSYISSVAAGVICGFGWRSYPLALDGIKGILDKG